MIASPPSLSELLRSQHKSFSAETFEGGEVLENQDLKELSFTQCTLKKMTFKHSTFERLSFPLSSAHQTNFENCRIDHSEGSRYFFEECRFSKSVFRNSDFSGGTFSHVDFTETMFENADFALCEFIHCRFDRVHFIHCNFNASVFENTHFQDLVFKDTTFKYVEGLTPEQEDFLKKQGAVVCPPVEIAFREILKKIFWNSRSPWARCGILALLFFLLGYHASAIVSFSKQLFFLEVNPLLTPIRAFQSLPEPSFFKGRLALPNFDFSQNLDYWIAETHRMEDKEALQVQNEIFQSFPSALRAQAFQGRLLYSLKKSGTLLKDPLQTQFLWLPVDARGEKMKLSFYYKNGLPQFRVYGKFKDGGYTLLSEIDTQTKEQDSPWVYFSEGITIPSTVSALCLELSRFPEQEIFLDDVNLETSL
jgi:hypothetical protein